MNLFTKLSDDVLDIDYFQSLYRKCSLISAEYNLSINKSVFLNHKEFQDSLRFADILSHSNKTNHRHLAYHIITNLNSEYNNNPYYRTFSKAVYSRLGNFPAISFLEIENKNHAELPFLRTIEAESKKIIQEVPDSENLIFTDSQYDLFNRLTNTTEYSFSGPTSMGKSFLIKAFIKKVIQNSPPENIVIIVPTRALINQFSIDLREELADLVDIYKYKIFTNSSISDITSEEESHYLFVLTPERLISYLSQSNIPPIGFIFVDESHKLANGKDSRSITTYTSIEKTIKRFGNIKLYFSSPNVSNPEIFLELFNRDSKNHSYRTEEAPVSQNLFFIDLIDKNIELIQDGTTIPIPSNGFFNHIHSVKDLILAVGKNKNNLIYCNSRAKTIKCAYDFALSLPKENETEEIQSAIRQIKEYIHPDYFLAELLQHKTAFHYGRLPQLVRNLVEKLYNEEEINHVFCTSTLLEGVNMPTKNIFIIDGKNGTSKFEPIDFWNLAGRAGRLAKELAGNIFVVQHPDYNWGNKEILIKHPIELKPTISNKIDRNLIRIEKLLKGDQISSKTQEELFILKYIANIISVDTLEIDANYQSPIIKDLIEKNKDKIIELAKEKTKEFEIPHYILSLNQSIDLDVQNNVYKNLLEIHKSNGEIVLPGSEFKYLKCVSVLEIMYDLYSWENAESKLQNKKSLKYYALLMNQWINGIPLSQIIAQSIKYYESNKKEIAISWGEYIPFNINNKKHINILIDNLIDDIEYILRFLFEKYFNHYHQIISKIVGEENAGENWASLLEYGTQNRIVIALQNIGLSRNTALKINSKHKNTLTISDGKLKKVNKEVLLKWFRKGSFEYTEVLRVL